MDDLKKQVSELFALQRKNADFSMKNRSISERKKQLKRLKSWIINHQEVICQAIHDDFKKPEFEVKTTEIYPLTSSIKHAIKHLEEWAASKNVENSLAYAFTRSKINKVPKGVCLIIAPWNYPFMLAIEPLISAISAGCTVIMKPSELTPHTSKVILSMVKEVFRPEEVSVILGDQTVAQELLKLPFDHIFFTGSPRVGKLIMEAAAKTLTSVTLELGGMNPTIVDETANLTDAAEKILWAKGMNAGQTCVSVNEIYIHETQKEKFVNALLKAQSKLYPDGFKKGENLSSVVSARHYKRLIDLMNNATSKGGIIVCGGETSDKNLWIHPTFISDVPADAHIRNEEIFGPLAVITSYTDIEQVLNEIRKKPTPLAAYIFSTKNKHIKHLTNSIHSGTLCVNETTIQFAHPELPFGGHNNSGLGKGHGYHGFLEFTHQRAELRQRRGFTSAKLIYPPYTIGWKKKLLSALIRWF